ncbi:MAG: RNA polymerase sporulation sigma factor SigE [Clostridia bacterium]|nr:RNA polymerase sporulation sigma factor SigE [Clostridia bacterium]
MCNFGKSFKEFFVKLKQKITRSYDSILYVNGSETLPPPLSADAEAAALQTIDTNSESRTLLIEHNLRLVVYIAKRFESTGIGIEDLVSIGTIGLIKAINTFKPDKNNKLATYASRCIENEILMYIRKNNPKRCEVSIEEPLNVDWDGNELLLSDVLGSDDDLVYRDLESTEEKKIIRAAVDSLDPRERMIVEMRFGLNGVGEKTQKEVADMLGISQSYISRLEKRIIRRLREEMERMQ